MNGWDGFLLVLAATAGVCTAGLIAAALSDRFRGLR